jgi:hypothetical protein
MAERSPSGVTDVVIANFVRLLAGEEMRASCATLRGDGRSEGRVEVGSCTAGAISIIWAGARTGLSTVGGRGESSFSVWSGYACNRCGSSSRSI